MSLSRRSDYNDELSSALNLHIHHWSIYRHNIHRIWNNLHPYEHLYGAEKLLIMLVILLKMIMPSFWVRHYGETKRSRYWILDAYTLLKPLLLGVILVGGYHQYSIVFLLVCVLLIDILVSIISILVLSDIFVKPVSARNYFILLGANLGEIVSGFAILYLHYDAIRYVNPTRMITWIDAIYYSMMTLSTVGYGDITQSNHAGGIISVMQMLFGFLFIGIVLAAYVNNIKIKSE